MKPETGWNKPEGWIKFTGTFAEVSKSGLNLQPICAHLLCIERTTRNVLVSYGFSLQSLHTTGDFSKSWLLLARASVKGTEACVKWCKKSGVASGLTVPSSRNETESKRLCAPKSTKEKGKCRQDLPSLLRNSHLVIPEPQYKWQGLDYACRVGLVDREERTRKGQLAKVGMLHLVGTNVGVWWTKHKVKKIYLWIVFEGYKNLGQLSCRWLKHIKKGEFKIQYTKWIQDRFFSVMGGDRYLILTVREGLLKGYFWILMSRCERKTFYFELYLINLAAGAHLKAWCADTQKILAELVLAALSCEHCVTGEVWWICVWTGLGIILWR